MLPRALIGICLLIAGLAAPAFLVTGEPHRRDIFLPQDCKLVTVTGNGFKLELKQFDEAKQNWAQASKEASEIVSPTDETTRALIGDETSPTDNDNAVHITLNYGSIGGSGRDNSVLTGGGDNSGAQRPTDYGLLDSGLLGWVEARASALLGRIERYSAEISSLPSGSGQRVVVEILLLNTLAHLDQLANENLPNLAWIRKKLNIFKKKQLLASYEQEIMAWIEKLIARNVQIESKIRGTNHPGNEWLKNTQAIRRVLDEQRYSDSITQSIVAYLKGKFNLMSRSSVYNFNKPAKRQDDGLYYWAAKGLSIPADFPFSAQDAIANGAMV